MSSIIEGVFFVSFFGLKWIQNGLKIEVNIEKMECTK